MQLRPAVIEQVVGSIAVINEFVSSYTGLTLLNNRLVRQ